MTAPQRDFQDARFFLLIDGFPYFLSEEPAPVYVHVRMSGDLDQASEYMGLKINGVTVCEGQTGFQDATLRDFGCFDVSQLLNNNSGPITLEAYASAGVGTPAGVVNTLEAHFVHPFGEPINPALASPVQKYTFTPLQATTTPIIQHAAPRSSSSALTKRAISLGGAKIDLETFAQIGFSLTAKVRDPNGMLANLFKSRKQPFGYSAASCQWFGVAMAQRLLLLRALTSLGRIFMSQLQDSQAGEHSFGLAIRAPMPSSTQIRRMSAQWIGLLLAGSLSSK